MSGYIEYSMESLKSVHKWGDITLAMAFIDLTSRLSTPGPLFLSSYSTLSYTSMLVIFDLICYSNYCNHQQY